MRRLGLVIALLAWAAPAAAADPGAPGTFDRSFGRGGVATLSDPFLSYLPEALVTHGRGVVLGAQGFVPASRPPVGPGFVVARFTASGRLDGRFGDDGTVETGLVSARLVAVPGGRIVAAGLAGTPYDPELVLLRYRPDGSLDRSFGTGGRAAVAVDPGDVYRRPALGVDPAGRVLVALGASVYRFSVAGARDTSFAPPLPGALATALAVDRDGGVVVVGNRPSDGRTSEALTVARLLPDGSLDPSFGDGGRIVDTRGRFGPAAMTVAPDGDIIVAGDACLTTGECGLALWRFTRDGDTKLTLTARRVAPLADGVAIDRTGAAVVVGTSYLTGGRVLAAVLRVTPAGRLDRGFGRAGVLLLRDRGPTVGPLVLADGRILVAARHQLGEEDPELLAPTDVAVVRLGRIWGGYDRRAPLIRVRRACARGRARVELRLVDRSRIVRLAVRLGGRRLDVRPGKRAILHLRRGGRLRIVAFDQAANRGKRSLLVRPCGLSG